MTDKQNLITQTKTEQETVALTLLRSGYTVRLSTKKATESRSKTVYMVEYWHGSE